MPDEYIGSTPKRVTGAQWNHALACKGVARALDSFAAEIVRNYLFKIFDRLGVSTRVELVLYCFQDRQSRSQNTRAAEAGKNGTNGTGGK
jgi:hypothetical protein